MIKLFEQFNSEQEIHDICKEYNIKNYTINDDGSIDVNGNVNLFNKRLIKLPLKFNRVSGYFNCTLNILTTLEGSPNYVGDVFTCSSNQLTSLKGCPNYVGDNFDCANNILTSLKGCSNYVGGNFTCSDNKLTSLEVCPKEIYGNFYCSYNLITTLKGIPEYINGHFYCLSNPINKIDVESNIKNNKRIYLTNSKIDENILKIGQYYLRMLFKYGLEYKIFNDDGSINNKRLDHFLDDFKEKDKKI